MKMEMLSRGGMMPRLATKTTLSKSSSIMILPAQREDDARETQCHSRGKCSSPGLPRPPQPWIKRPNQPSLHTST